MRAIKTAPMPAKGEVRGVCRSFEGGGKEERAGQVKDKGINVWERHSTSEELARVRWRKARERSRGPLKEIRIVLEGMLSRRARGRGVGGGGGGGRIKKKRSLRHKRINLGKNNKKRKTGRRPREGEVKKTTEKDEIKREGCHTEYRTEGSGKVPAKDNESNLKTVERAENHQNYVVRNRRNKQRPNIDLSRLKICHAEVARGVVDDKKERESKRSYMGKREKKSKGKVIEIKGEKIGRLDRKNIRRGNFDAGIKGWLAVISIDCKKKKQSETNKESRVDDNARPKA